jgi:hypothetical protein
MCDIQKGRRGILILDGALLVFGLLAGKLAAAMIRYLPDCVFARVGITCPACGATRCVRELFSGHFGEAFRLHPFLFCLCFYLAAALVLLNAGYLIPQSHCRKLGKAMVSGKAVIVLVVLYALFGIVRMVLLPFFH